MFYLWCKDGWDMTIREMSVKAWRRQAWQALLCVGPVLLSVNLLLACEWRLCPALCSICHTQVGGMNEGGAQAGV